MYDQQEKIEALNEELLDLNEQIGSIQAKADADKRDLSEDETSQIDGLMAKFAEVEDNIARRKRIVAQSKKLAEQIASKLDDDDDDDGQKPRSRRSKPGHIQVFEDKGKCGFRNFGEFAKAVASAAQPGRGMASVDPRLIANAPTTFSQEGVGEEGGFAVPPDFRQAIVDAVMNEEDSLMARTDQQQSSSNSMVFPVDETTAWQTSGGILAYWDGEADQLTQSKIALKERTIRLNKLTALVPVTEELMEDAPALTTYLSRKAPEKIMFKTNLAIFNGTGAGQPLGILQAPATVSVAKESGQAADTIVFNNILNMWARMYAPSRRNAIWLINQDIEPQLMGLAFKDTAAAGPVYLPPGGLSASPYGTLMNRPVIPSQVCETLGDLGDIVLCDFSQYMTATRVGGVRQEVSVHLWFDYDVTAFKFVLRVAGMPWLSSAISPRDGSNTLSPFVSLAARA